MEANVSIGALPARESALDSDVLLFRHFLLRLHLRNGQCQNTIFKLRSDVALLYILTNIEASLAGTCKTFTTDIFSGFFIFYNFYFSIITANLTIIRFSI